MPASDPAAELHVGPDLVRLENGFVVIYSPRDKKGSKKGSVPSNVIFMPANSDLLFQRLELRVSRNQFSP
jgi:hypothetical protein